ncbi:MAG: hypothetical protein ACNA8W_07145 [Bradymonadaceae bacterium]
MKYFSLEKTEEGLVLEETVRGRFVGALVRLVVIFPTIFIALSIFYIPDYLGRYAEQEPVFGFFWLIVLAVALLIGIVVAALRLTRLERWVFDLKARELAYETQGLYGAGHGATVPLKEITRAELHLRSAPAQSKLVFELAGGHREVVAQSRFGKEEIEEIANRLQTLFRKLHLAVTWDRELD